MRTAKTDQTGRMSRLILVFAGRTLILLVLSCRCSFNDLIRVSVHTCISIYVYQCHALLTKALINFNFCFISYHLLLERSHATEGILSYNI